MTKGLVLRHGSQPRAALFPDAGHPFGLLPLVLLPMRDALRAPMERAERVLTFQRQILRAVVGLVSVQMVHYLTAFKGAAESLLHQVAVLQDVALLGVGVVG